jgi:hypothetical protein
VLLAGARVIGQIHGARTALRSWELRRGELRLRARHLDLPAPGHSYWVRAEYPGAGSLRLANSRDRAASFWRSRSRFVENDRYATRYNDGSIRLKTRFGPSLAHPALARRKTASARRHTAAPYVAREEGSGNAANVRELVGAQGTELATVPRAGSIEAVKHAVLPVSASPRPRVAVDWEVKHDAWSSSELKQSILASFSCSIERMYTSAVPPSFAMARAATGTPSDYASAVASGIYSRRPFQKQMASTRPEFPVSAENPPARISPVLDRIRLHGGVAPNHQQIGRGSPRVPRQHMCRVRRRNADSSGNLR